MIQSHVNPPAQPSMLRNVKAGGEGIQLSQCGLCQLIRVEWFEIRLTNQGLATGTLEASGKAI